MASSVPNNEATQFKSGQKAVENGRKGGIASGEAKRKKKSMKEMLELCLEMKNKDGQTYRELATIGLLKGAMKGNAYNYETILKTLGEYDEMLRDRQQQEINKVDELLKQIKEEANK